VNEAGRALATLIRLVGDFRSRRGTRCRTPLHGAGALARCRRPSNPRAWLVNVGRNKAIDRFAGASRFAARQDELTHELLLNRSLRSGGDRIASLTMTAAADLHLLPSGIRD